MTALEEEHNVLPLLNEMQFLMLIKVIEPPHGVQVVNMERFAKEKGTEWSSHFRFVQAKHSTQYIYSLKRCFAFFYFD